MHGVRVARQMSTVGVTESNANRLVVIRRVNMTSRQQQIEALQKDWDTNPRWKGVKRNFTAEDVVRLRGSVQIEHTLARRGAEKLWHLLNTEPFVNTLGALTGNQAMQQVKAGLKAIYLSG